MTATIEVPRTASAPRLGALFRSELLRARSRRSLFWLTLAAALSVVAAALMLFLSTAHVTQADLDSATTQFIADQNEYYEQCLADPTISEKEKADACWKPDPDQTAADAIWVLEKRPMDQTGLTGLISLAGGVAIMVALLVAATTGGADWGARTMGLVVSWEPRRVRLLAVRLAIVVIIGTLVVAALVLLALVLGGLIAGAHGLEASAAAKVQMSESYQVPDMAEARELALRWLPLAALAAAGSFGVAMLARSTGWAIGASIGFVTIVESVLRAIWPWGSQWLIQTNIAAWLSGELTVLVDPAAANLESSSDLGGGMGTDDMGAGYITITDERALVTLGCIVAVVVIVSAIAFRRRDIE